jgi:hypothetical protein
MVGGWGWAAVSWGLPQGPPRAPEDSVTEGVITEDSITEGWESPQAFFKLQRSHVRVRERGQIHQWLV